MGFIFDSLDNLAFGACCLKIIIAKNMLSLDFTNVKGSFPQYDHYLNCENALNEQNSKTFMNNSYLIFYVRLYFLYCLESQRLSLL